MPPTDAEGYAEDLMSKVVSGDSGLSVVCACASGSHLVVTSQ